jgi:ubiquinone biosynthesis protein
LGLAASGQAPGTPVSSEIARTVERLLDELVDAVGTERGPTAPATLLARTADLARSSFFLWLESGLQIHEGVLRAAYPRERPSPAHGLARALVMVALASDLYLGYAALRGRGRRWPALARPRDWELQHQRGAARVLDTTTSLGGTLIKAGQLASVRGDLLPAPYVQALATLQDRVPPRPWPVIERALVAELGRPLDAVFARVEPSPVAAASLAQVHRAWLRRGERPVALKVQYPDVRALVEADLSALAGIVQALARLEPDLRLQPILDHLRATLPLELDFAHEAHAMTGLRRALAHRADVRIPSVIRSLTTPRLVVMDYVPGIKITDRLALEQAGIDPAAVARLLNEVYAEQILRLGRLHADPHPGNLFVQPGPRLVLLDHGLTVPLRPALVAALREMVGALRAGDLAGLSVAMARLGFPARTDLSSLLEVAGVLLGAGGEESIPDIGRRLGRVIGDVPPELITVSRALSLLAGITRVLDPDLDVLETVGKYA